MVGAAGMSGFVSFLEISPTDSNQPRVARTSRQFPSPATASTGDWGPETTSDLPLSNESIEGGRGRHQQAPENIEHTHYSGVPLGDRNDEPGIPEQGIPETGIPITDISKRPSLESEQHERYKLAHQSGIPETGTPSSGIPDTGAPKSNLEATQRGIPETGIPYYSDIFESSDVRDASTADSGPPAAATTLHVDDKKGIPVSGVPLNPSTSYPRPHRVRRATRVQDGHSLGEQALYDALWQAGRPYSDDARIITLGYRNMSELARLTVNNCKANIQALIQKLAVAAAAPFSHSQGTTYIVYNFTTILQRRKAAGLTHCIRSRGVVFVDPESGTPITRPMHQKSGIPESGIPPRVGLPESGKSGVPYSDKEGVPETGSQRKENSTRQAEPKTSTSISVPERLATALQQLVAFFDGDAVTLLWNECQMRAPDCTTDEVLYFARQKASVCRNGKIQNPVGFLLTAVPKCFEGEAFHHFRAEQVRLNEEERKRKEAQEERSRLQTAELHREEELHRLAEQRLQALTTEEYQALHDTVRRELIRSWKNFSLLTEQAQELNIRSRMLREFREKKSQRT